MNTFSAHKLNRPPRQSGLSLVEIMVAITLSLVLTAGIIQVVTSTKQSYNVQQGLARLQENARLVNEMIVRNISVGGYMGCLDTINPLDPDTITNTLSNPNNVDYDFGAAVFGTEGGNANTPDSLTIRSANEGSAVPMTGHLNMPDDDVLMVDPAHPNYGNLQQWDIVTISDCSHASVFMITNDPQTDPTPGRIEHKTGVAVPTGFANAGLTNASTDLQWPFVGNGNNHSTPARLYKVNSNSYGLRNTRNGVALVRPSLFRDQHELIENVENLQVTYGIANDIFATNNLVAEQYLDADQVADWNTVVSIRLTLTINSGQRVDPNPLVGDGMLRKSFTTTVRVKNRAPGGLS